MASRIDLNDDLRRLLGSGNVYFQPPESIKLTYPCIIYSLADIKTIYSDDSIHRAKRLYEITYISKQHDDQFIDKMLKSFTMISFGRSFTTDNLHHTVFRLYY